MASSPLPRLNEQPFFFDVERDRVFGVLHLPAAQASSAVLVCPAFAEEKLWSHRVYVTLARELAARGAAVLRLDFRGEGESDREFEETTVATRVTDALRAAEELRRHVPASTPLVLLGHRVGGSIAAAAVQAGCEAAGLVIWDPVPDGNEYLLQLLRSNLTTQIAVEGKVTRTREMLVKEIQEGRPVVIEGYALTRELFDGLKALDWVKNWRTPAKGALILEMARGEEPTLSAPFKELSAREPTVSCAVVTEQPFWRETRQFHQRAPNLMTRTVEWLDAMRQRA